MTAIRKSITPDISDTEPEKPHINVLARNKYILLYILEGNARVQNGTFTCKMSDNQLMVIDSHMAFGYNFLNPDNYKCLYIEMHPSIFSSDSDDDEFLRCFENIKPKDSVIDCNGDNNILIKNIVNSIVECNLLHLGKSHILPRIFTLISQIDLYYDKTYGYEKVSTNYVSAKIIDYINRNYLKTITYQTIIDKFYVSKPVINEILHKFTGYTLREYIEFLRLREADNLLGKNHYDIHKIAELCGFNTYSTFYRAYKRVYGIAPSEKQPKQIKHWPFSK